jgi:hypothetical protein
MLANNASFILRGPSDIFLSPLLMPNNPVGRALVAVVAMASVSGIVRQARAQEWKPIVFVLPFYAAVTLFWNFQDSNNRYFLPFWPLFAAGLWLEAKHVFAMVKTTLLSGRKIWNKVAGLAIGAAVIVLGFAMVWNYVTGARSLMFAKSTERGALLQSKREAYNWVSHNTDIGSRVIAYEDVGQYLYTGRESLSPMASVIAELNEPARLEESFHHLTDLPRAIGAEYWIFSDDDFLNSSDEIVAQANIRMSELERALPVVYQSQDGRVRIHELGCVQHPEAVTCQAADRVLFPEHGEGDETLRTQPSIPAAAKE